MTTLPLCLIKNIYTYVCLRYIKNKRLKKLKQETKINFKKKYMSGVYPLVLDQNL